MIENVGGSLAVHGRLISNFFKTRINEQKKCIITGSTASMVAKNIVESGHNPEFETRVLHMQNSPNSPR